MCLAIPVMFLVGVGICAWAGEFQVSFVVGLSIVGLLLIGMQLVALRTVNNQLRTMRQHQTQAHRSFFDNLGPEQELLDAENPAAARTLAASRRRAELYDPTVKRVNRAHPQEMPA